MKKLYWEILPVAAVLLVTTACPSGNEHAKATPSHQANAPSLTVSTKVLYGPVQSATRGGTPTPAPTINQQESGSEASGGDPVPAMIAKVDKEYQGGQENYKAGHLEAAKQNFDRAFDLLLSGPVDVRSDERLQKEFDLLLDGVNGLELQALQEGDGFTEQKSEPAPIDEANEVTFPVDPNIKAKAEAEVKSTHSDLPLMMTDQVASYINYFSSARGRATLENALVRSGRYHDMIQSVLKEEGVPQDLIFLAQAESGFHPLALSRAGARGMWQFMASRAKGYGLERNWWIDDRQDPEKSTRAAARHLKDLYNQFGDWYLAMAAYNSGPGTVQAAVKRTGYADFWQLYQRDVLPKETRNYVPIIVAVTIMAKNPEQYGLENLVKQKPVPYDTVKIDYPVDLRLVAECVDASAADLQDLNPSLLRLTTPRDTEFELHLPVGSKDRYQSAMTAIPQEMRVWWRYHKVSPGDTLATVARTYRTTSQSIAEANNLEPNVDLAAESKLIIPIAPGRTVAAEASGSYSKVATRYKVRKSDTVERVADNFGVPAAMIRKWNHLKGDNLQGRRVLYVRLPLPPNANETAEETSVNHKSKSSLRKVSRESVAHHKVQKGETLSSIASTHHTTVAALKRDNGNLATLRPGMVLVIR